MLKNPILRTDSYKFSHYQQYPAGMTKMKSYFEARGGEFDTCTLYGLQYYLKILSSDFISYGDVEEAAEFAKGHGVPFNEKGFREIVDVYGGQWPVVIKAIPEGKIVPVGTPLFTVESAYDDPDVAWVPSWLETMLSRVWYPSTIATCSRESKKILKKYLDLTSDTPEEIVFKLHDFGGRGVASAEQAGLGGSAHLLSFLGTDTCEAIEFAQEYYSAGMCGFSIPAAEHSTVTSWGKDREFDFYRNFIKTFLTDRPTIPGVPKLAACVSDSYNLWNAVDFWTAPEQVKQIKESGGTLVIRPDSGEPVTTLCQLFDRLEARLPMVRNQKGYLVLPPYFRVIQGDGVDRAKMEAILAALTARGYSASNIAFGSGGGLLQKVDRDTQKFAYKCFAAKVDGQWVDVYKDPATDPGKRSKTGNLDEGLQVVFDRGQILKHHTFDEVRSRIEL